MHVAVAIVGYRNPDDIVHCLGALGTSTYDDYEVIICENGGPHAFATLAAALPLALPGGQPVRAVLAPANIGYGAGVNRCISETSNADAWWVLNPDTRPESNAMAALVERLAHGDCHAVGGTLIKSDGRVQSRGGRWQPLLARAVSIGFGTPADQSVDVASIERSQNYLSGASMLVGRRFFQAVGPMREDYFLYCEEVEWFLRGRTRGMRLGFAPDALVYHQHGSTTGSGEVLSKMGPLPIYLNTRNQILLTRDNYHSHLPLSALAALVVLSVKCLRGRAWRQFGYGVRGWLAGLRDERRAPAWLWH
jgi:GT2 family glycosyltransferase